MLIYSVNIPYMAYAIFLMLLEGPLGVVEGAYNIVNYFPH